MRSLAALSLMLLALVGGGGCGTGGIEPEAGDTSRGKEIFTKGADGKQACSSCHKLADAGATGTIGPDLDASFGPGREEGFSESTIREIVRQQIKYPIDADASRDVPPMPANLAEGEDLDAVAAYIAQCAGSTDKTACPGPDTGGAGGGTKATDGKSIFTSAGCGSCHIFQDAGGTGQIGPNLDESKTPLQAAIQQIQNGGGGMPAFKDQLTDKQIRAVAEYVAAGGGK